MDPSLALSVEPRSERMQAAIAELQRIEHWQTENNILEEDLPTIPVDKTPKKSIKKRLQGLFKRKKHKKGDVVEVEAEVETREEEDNTTSEYENLTALPPMPKITVTPVEDEIKEKRKPRKLVKKKSIYVREEDRMKEVEKGMAMPVPVPDKSAFFLGERETDEGDSGFMSSRNKSMFGFGEEEVKDRDEEGERKETKTLGNKKSMWF